MKVADLFDAAYSFLPFQAINGCLDRGIGWPVFFGKSFLNFANGGIAASPQRLHNLQLQLRQFRFGHVLLYYMRMSRYYYNSSDATVFCESFRSRHGYCFSRSAAPECRLTQEETTPARCPSGLKVNQCYEEPGG